MKILFAGTPSIAVPSLEAINKEHEIVGVLTNPDRPFGRGKKIKYSPVKEKALQLELKVFQYNSIRGNAIKELEELNADILVVVAFGRIFGPKFLSIFPKGAVNLHPSLLPQLRGPSPIASAILNGLKETGITIQKLAIEMDAGDILFQKSINLEGNETTQQLTDKCAILGANAIIDVLNNIEEGEVNPTPQNHDNASYCGLFKKEDGIIDWNKDSIEIDQQVRAYNPWPLARTFFGEKYLNILEAMVYKGELKFDNTTPGTVVGIDKKWGILVQTGNGLLVVTKLQLQSKKPLDWKSFLNGIKDFTGCLLGG